VGSPSPFIRSVAVGSLEKKKKKIPIAPVANTSIDTKTAEVSDLIKDVKKKRKKLISGR